ncbi:hypothetical protein SISSUDRAFT_466028 [Sistotremastrum suecicum HHB10207 ss-3]|uniref:Uncharacterized protein n=1 Tax=Sistotremastrum suecicum HHB10207 ss-3 TaxID=1314776 RepID=A0A166FEL9_9AGAM|nr:hypothetical protein SISSUDRAFT_466028 [Sistotremastrum suecicum HHB10207 ss-3]
MRASALDTLLKNNGYACTHTDLGDGWKALTSQSLLAWQSIYQLHPSSTAANADPTIHTCVVMGSRNGKSMIVLDGVNIIGYTDNFVKDGTLSWSTESSNAPLNGIISFEHKVVGDATNIGSRVMNAKLWKKGDPTPDAITHSGHDFFDDVSKFDGTYNTSCVAFRTPSAAYSTVSELVSLTLYTAMRAQVPKFKSPLTLQHRL